MRRGERSTRRTIRVAPTMRAATADRAHEHPGDLAAGEVGQRGGMQPVRGHEEGRGPGVRGDAARHDPLVGPRMATRARPTVGEVMGPHDEDHEAPHHEADRAEEMAPPDCDRPQREPCQRRDSEKAQHADGEDGPPTSRPSRATWRRVAGGAHCHPIVNCAHSATATTEKIESAAASVARLRRPEPSASSGWPPSPAAARRAVSPLRARSTLRRSERGRSSSSATSNSVNSSP